MEEKGVSQVTERSHVVNPLTVGKPRLVLDYRHINPHLARFRSKYEGVPTALEIFQTSIVKYYTIQIFSLLAHLVQQDTLF